MIQQVFGEHGGGDHGDVISRGRVAEDLVSRFGIDREQSRFAGGHVKRLATHITFDDRNVLCGSVDALAAPNLFAGLAIQCDHEVGFARSHNNAISVDQR